MCLEKHILAGWADGKDGNSASSEEARKPLQRFAGTVLRGVGWISDGMGSIEMDLGC